MAESTDYNEITGSEHDNRRIVGTDGADRMDGLGGNDRLYGFGGNDLIYGGEGDDDAAGGTGDDTLYGGQGSDELWGEEGDDTLYGGEGDDYIWGDAGDDTLSGGEGADTFIYHPDYDTGGSDTIKDFTVGEDAIDLSEFASITDLSDLTITADGSDVILDLSSHGGGTIRLEGVSPSDLSASDFAFRVNQTVEGDSGSDMLYGGAGDDTLRGHGGYDRLLSRDGDDTLEGGAGNDYLWGGEGADTFVFKPGDGNDTLCDFTDGEDLIDLRAFTGISGFEDLSLHSATVGGAPAIILDLSAHGGGQVQINASGNPSGDADVTADTLDATDFLFHEAPGDATPDGG